MSIQFSQDTDYWLHKTKVFLHDPPDKAIHIPGHEERANRILAALGMSGSTLDAKEYKEADIIASGMDRAILPGYVAGNESRNGAVDFLESPQITHPTGDEAALALKFSHSGKEGAALVQEINQAICELVKKDLGTVAGSGEGLSEHTEYRGQEEKFAPARFHYLFFLLRRRLARENVGGMGGLWHRMPADTRIPDHSIWQHSGLASALASSVRLSDENRASLMVYALTPVQDFVGRARKLRDFWSGSIILSWLAFEGIKAVIQLYGADHIVYPSLHDQPLVDDILRQMGIPDEWLGDRENAGIASFPNKFVFLAPTGREDEAAKAIRAAIDQRWKELGEATLARIEKCVGREDSYIKQLFARQLISYWEHHWGAAPLVGGVDREDVEKLLHRETIESAFAFWKDSQKLYASSGEAQLYSVSHRLAQAMLAAGKSHRRDSRKQEPGIKCDMFREFEIVHYDHRQGGDRNPKPSEDPFWIDLRNNWQPKSDFGPNERLSALGLVKRLAYRVCRDIENHPLGCLFREAESFPSTTEMALTDWWRQLHAKVSDQNDNGALPLAGELAVFEYRKSPDKTRRKLAQLVHDLDEPDRNRERYAPKEEKAAAVIMRRLHPVRDIHKYYAVLMMDGDRMGKLVNGDTLGSTWTSVLHPVLAGKLAGEFDPAFKEFWQKRLQERRLVSPAVHAAISEALGDFALHTVPFIIEKHNGRLIYAGGDDVCAVLPASSVLDTAMEIATAYNAGFIGIKPGNQATMIAEESNPAEFEKIGIHLGSGDAISISAGIMIAHHKKPLGRVIKRAHELLEQAKNRGGRNGLVLEVDKRAGGGRTFSAKWDDTGSDGTLLDSFFRVADALQKREKEVMSSSLAYRLDSFRDGMAAIVKKYPDQLPSFVFRQLQRSGTGLKEEKKNLRELATHISAILNSRKGDATLPTEALVVANFIGHCRQERRDVSGGGA